MRKVDERKSNLPTVRKTNDGKKIDAPVKHQCICARLFDALYNNEERGCKCNFCSTKGGSLQNLLGSLKDLSSSSTQTLLTPVTTSEKEMVTEANPAEKYIETLLEPKEPIFGCGEHTWNLQSTRSVYSNTSTARDTKSLDDIQGMLSAINENLESILNTLKEKKEQLKSQTLLHDDSADGKSEKSTSKHTNSPRSMSPRPTLCSLNKMSTTKHQLPYNFVPSFGINNKYVATNMYTGLPNVSGILYRYKPASCPNINYFENLGKMYSSTAKITSKTLRMSKCNKKDVKKGKKKGVLLRERLQSMVD